MKVPRQKLIKGWSQKTVESLRVLIAGCGAIGSSSGIKLARLGVKKFFLVDQDILEVHNIYNQEYTLSDLKKPKVQALGDRLYAVNRKVFALAYAGKVQDCPPEFFDCADIYLSCFDNFTARFFLNFMAVNKGKTVIDAGIREFSGTVRTTIPGKTFCMECHPSLIPQSRIKASCSRNPIPSTAITAAHASDIQVMQMLKVIFGWEFNPYIYFDIRQVISEPIELQRNPDCALCGDLDGKKTC